MTRQRTISTRKRKSSRSRRMPRAFVRPLPARGRQAWAILLLLLILGLAGAAARATEAIRLASDVWPPFTDRPDEPRLAIDLVQTALERAGVSSEVSIVEEFGIALQGLRDGTFDGSAAIWRSPEREEHLLFSGPYLENRLVLVGRKGSDVSPNSLTDLAGKRLGLVGSYDYGEAVRVDGGPELVFGRSDQDNVLRLLAGKVDYILVDDLLVQNARQYQPEEVEQKVAVGSAPLIRRSLHFAVRRDLAEAESIVERFNAAIRKMVADGTYNRILQLNWIRVDVDGDGQLEYVMTGRRAGKTAPATGYQAVPASVSGPAAETQEQYWIDGQMYDGWQTVPERYKLDTLSGGPASPALTLFKTSF